ncbi:hypothetical protein HPB52_010500 [Rhipicephalus sanguineus]|uniref:Protein kinase domain-containing protein n=1 Tax=Rhipicephalus sanguineus TaxID=34632 RepID=A0A9D4Q600_RHISA|nr:hypothetical protein HPB52_010500 [Rhipicephalus sanguineus]
MGEPLLVCDDEEDADERVDEMNSAISNRVLADVLPPGPVLADWHSSHDKYPHSCGKCYNDCLNRLTTLCDSEDVLDFNRALKPSFRGTKLRKIAETVDAETYIVITGHKTQTPVDTVVQLYAIDTHTASRIYCNLFTCKIVFVKDTLPENFAKAYEEFHRSNSCRYHPPPDSRPKVQRYMLVESDYSGHSILRSKIMPSQAISIIGQVACSLAVAERELQFEHRNLHEGNIMVLPSSFKNQHFLINGRTCCVRGSGLKITLFDDNFSRITYDNEVIMRMKGYDRVYKEKTPIYITMEKIINDQWEAFHPETNAQWLAYLCGHLSDYLTVPNPTAEWQQKLDLLALMQRDLQRFRSADEFVWNYINKMGHVHRGREYEPCSWGAGHPSTSARSTHAGLLSFLRRKHRGDDQKTPTDSTANAARPVPGCSYSSHARGNASSPQHHGQRPR